MADENYAIKVQFEGINDAIADFQKLQTAVANIKAPVFNLGGAEAAKIAEASLKKLQLEIDTLEKKKAQSAANDATRSASLLAQLEKQKAASSIRVSDGADKEAARIAQETLRYKQQIAAIDAKIFNPVDIANAKALAAEINKLNLEKIKKGFDDASPVTFNQFISASTEKARDLAEQLQNTSQTLERIGISFNQVSSAANQAFLAFDTAKTKVATLSNESTAFANTAVKLSGDLKNQVTSIDILSAQYEILSSGFTSAADASEIARVSVLGAKAGFTDTATVADATTSVLNAYGLAASDAASIVDKFAVVQDKGKTTIAQFAGQLGNIAPIAKAAGVSFDEVAAAIATVTASGVKTESAVSGTRQAIVNLLKPTGEAARELEKYGIANSAATLKAEGLSGVLKRLAANGATSSEQLSKIFTDVDGLAAVLPLISGNLGKFNENLEAVGKSSGKAKAGFDVVANSAEGRLTEATNKINEALINIGRGSTLAFAPFFAAVGGLVNVFNSLPAPVQGSIGALIGLAGSVATTGAAIAAVGAATPAFLGGLKLFAPALVTVGSSSAVASSGLATLGATSEATTLSLNKAAVGINVLKTSFAGLLIFGAIESFNTFNNVLTRTTNISKDAKKAYDDYLVTLATPIIPPESPFPDQRKEIFDNLSLLEKTNQFIFDSLDKQSFGLLKRFTPLQGAVDTAIQQQKIGFSDAITLSNKLAEATQNRINSVSKGEKLSKRDIDDTRKAIESNIKAVEALAIAQSDDAGKSAKKSQLAFLDRQLEQFNKLTSEVDKNKSAQIQSTEEVSKAQKQAAKELADVRNAEAERAISRKISDEKTANERRNAQVVADIERANAKTLDAQKRTDAQALEKLKAEQQVQLQDRQRTFDDRQNQQKIQVEQQIQKLKESFDNQQREKQRAFDNAQASAKETLANRLAAIDQAATDRRAERDKQITSALITARSAIAIEGAATPEEKSKLVDQQRIIQNAASLATGTALTQDQLIAQAKQLAQVFAITTKEQQEKVLFALDAIEKANDAKRAELDKVEDLKREAEKRALQKAFDEEQQLAKQTFEDGLRQQTIDFESSVLTPQKQALERTLQDQKLAFERGELATLKQQQLTQENALKLQQETEIEARQLAFANDLEAKKFAFKQQEIALDRKYEDEKIAREAAFKAEQRKLDEQSAAKVMGIKSLSNLPSAAVGLPKFAQGVTNFVGGAALVGERGAEIVTLPRGSNVIPANQTKNILNNSGGNKTFNINVTTQGSDPVAIALEVQRELARAMALSF
ncbi:MAG: phage tail tape measure protein [Pseudanabaena sp. M152S2SP2A07QC]|nr:phage tail tape measure protein [Pseudanabaena sp. M109S1SP2A07QC]MCA6546627.1 phage tail tape measure protein [Pseudanabaena sp. M152S2SP2A07QC]